VVRAGGAFDKPSNSPYPSLTSQVGLFGDSHWRGRPIRFLRYSEKLDCLDQDEADNPSSFNCARS